MDGVGTFSCVAHSLRTHSGLTWLNYLLDLFAWLFFLYEFRHLIKELVGHLTWQTRTEKKRNISYPPKMALDLLIAQSYFFAT